MGYSWPGTWSVLFERRDEGTKQAKNARHRQHDTISPSFTKMSDQNRHSEPSAAVTRSKGKKTSVSGARVPNIASPPGSKTPPSMHSRKTTLFFPETGGRQKSQNGSDSIDPDALTKALKDFEEAGHRRERTPGTSPSRKRQRVYGDR